MAVPSKSSARSTRRSNALAGDAALPDRTSTSTSTSTYLLGKRSRDVETSAGNGYSASSKKPKAQKSLLPARPKLLPSKGARPYEYERRSPAIGNHGNANKATSLRSEPAAAAAAAAATATATAATSRGRRVNTDDSIVAAAKDAGNGSAAANGEAKHHRRRTSAEDTQQPAKPAAGSDKRTLRSQDGGSRSKSELALYFPNYDEFISNEPKGEGKCHIHTHTYTYMPYLENELLRDKREFLFFSFLFFWLLTDRFPPTEPVGSETRIFIQDDPTRPQAASKQLLPTSPTKSASSKPSPRKHAPQNSQAAAPSLTGFETIDLGPALARYPDNDADPLDAQLYHKAHRRAERQEKQLKNIEKERAQHEKVQLERLFDGLRGPDWLRVMGISGITEGERRAWEGKRAWCVREVGALLEKFRLWKEEERRRKLEKETFAQEEEEEEEEEEGEGEEEEEGEEDENEDEEDEEEGEADKRQAGRKGRKANHLSPASSDVDAMAALQLHNETLSASASRPKSSASGKNKNSKNNNKKAGWKAKAGGSLGEEVAEEKEEEEEEQPPPAPPFSSSSPSSQQPPAETRPIKSFFAKPHQRAAALDKNRRSGRNRLAFGQPLPDPLSLEFELPEELKSEEAMRSNARSRRRARRGTG